MSDAAKFGDAWTDLLRLKAEAGEGASARNTLSLIETIVGLRALLASPGPTESDRRDTERLDAARYRFLRERMEIRSEATLLGHFARCVSVQIGRSRIGALRDAYQQCERDDAFDAAIDAAMSSVGSSNATEEGAERE